MFLKCGRDSNWKTKSPLVSEIGKDPPLAKNKSVLYQTWKVPKAQKQKVDLLLLNINGASQTQQKSLVFGIWKGTHTNKTRASICEALKRTQHWQTKNVLFFNFKRTQPWQTNMLLFFLILKGHKTEKIKVCVVSEHPVSGSMCLTSPSSSPLLSSLRLSPPPLSLPLALY